MNFRADRRVVGFWLALGYTPVRLLRLFVKEAPNVNPYPPADPRPADWTTVLFCTTCWAHRIHEMHEWMDEGGAITATCDVCSSSQVVEDAE